MSLMTIRVLKMSKVIFNQPNIVFDVVFSIGSKTGNVTSDRKSDVGFAFLASKLP